MTLTSIVELNVDAFTGISDRHEFKQAALAFAKSRGVQLTEADVDESIDSILNPHVSLADYEYERAATGCTCAFCTCSYAPMRV